MADYETMKAPQAPRFIEDDLGQLKQLDEQIAELLRMRADRLEMIHSQHDQNQQRIMDHNRWFNQVVRGETTESDVMESEVPHGVYGRH